MSPGCLMQRSNRKSLSSLGGLPAGTAGGVSHSSGEGMSQSSLERGRRGADPPALALVVGAAAAGVYVMRQQRKYVDMEPREWEHFLYVGKVAMVGWMLHFSECWVW